MTALRHSRAPHGLTAVLFDWDDTLADSFPARLAALRRVFSEVGVCTPSPEEFFRGLRGTSLETALAQLEAANSWRLNLFDRYRRAYWHKGPNGITLYAGVEQVLLALRARGVKLGIVTSKGRSFQVEERTTGLVAELADAEVSDLFSAVVGYEDVVKPKPHPEAVLLALKQLGASPEKALVVGDSAADMASGRAAGCWTCLARWGASTYQTSVEETAPDMVVETPEELLALDYAGVR
ncbi:MAG: HAD family hydrolase [Chloroflexota bacterium]|nr:HAD family hydrolase [Chloroflexota bacterium]